MRPEQRSLPAEGGGPPGLGSRGLPLAPCSVTGPAAATAASSVFSSAFSGSRGGSGASAAPTVPTYRSTGPSRMTAASPVVTMAPKSWLPLSAT